MIALVAHPSQRELLRLLCSRLRITAVLARTRWQEAPASVFTQMRTLLDTCAPRACIFLWPYPGMKEDALACLERQVPVLSAGPMDALLRWGGQHRFSPLFQAAQAQRRSPDFGEPVYLRRVTGGGTGLHSAWWAACQALSEAQDLMEAPLVEVYVAACKAGQKHHLALSASFANRATAHLIAAPVYSSPSLELTLLGSGGLVFSDSAANAPAVISAEGARFLPPAFLHPEPAWIQDFLDHPDRPAVNAALQLQLLCALRRALRLRQLVRIAP